MRPEVSEQPSAHDERNTEEGDQHRGLRRFVVARAAHHQNELRESSKKQR